MGKIKFAVIGDCHYSQSGNYGTRDCLGAKNKLKELIDILNKEKLDFVFGIGDYGNGDCGDEILQMLDVYKASLNPTYFALGNHDLVKHSQQEAVKLLKMPNAHYTFSVSNYKFIVLNPFEMSRYCPEDSDEYKSYTEYIKNHEWAYIQPWPGIMKEETWLWLENTLVEAAKNNQEVIVFSHVPTYGFHGREPACIPEYQRMLELLDKFSNVRAYIAGHCHKGGIDVRKGVLHKTLRAVCDNELPTACVFEADENSIEVFGIGAENDFKHNFEIKKATISGYAPKNSFVMTNCGEIVEVGDDGKFSLEVPCAGMYSLKAVMDKHDDLYIPFIEAPASEIQINLTKNNKRKLYTGTTDGYSVMRITDGNEPVRWFDIAGTLFGSLFFDENTWYENCDLYWCNGKYAFTAEGEVNICKLPKHKRLTEYGLYKGDLHAHLIHGENFYVGNIQQSAFIGKAEGYDWLYIAAGHGNDKFPTDVHFMAHKLSTPDFLYRINEEYPKSRSNHFGNCCSEPVFQAFDAAKISSLEVANKYIWEKGGATVPVHPFFGHMSFRQLCLWLICQPEKMPCIDFFYDDDFPKEMAEDYWFMLLNRGYMFGCFATSDAAFDVGRTPGYNRGSTYLYMESLSEENIKKAILNRRTMVSWDCAALIFSIDNLISGDIIKADGSEHCMTVKAMWQKNRKGVLRIIRNGKNIKQIPVSFNNNEEEYDYEYKFTENENSWYLAILESEDGKIRSVASPIYFRNDSFVPPEVIKLKKSIPTDIIAECEKLTPEQLSRPELIDYFAEKLKNI